VPYLVRDDGTGLEDSPLICLYLDHLDGNPKFDFPAGVEGTEARRLEALARSLVDGLSVWSRELARPQNERSPGVIQHETERARRMIDLWEAEIANPLMRGKLNILRTGAGSAQSRFPLAARAPEALRVVRRNRRAPFVHGNRATECAADTGARR
jgi:glutathione S-transferase